MIFGSQFAFPYDEHFEAFPHKAFSQAHHQAALMSRTMFPHHPAFIPNNWIHRQRALSSFNASSALHQANLEAATGNGLLVSEPLYKYPQDRAIRPHAAAVSRVFRPKARFAPYRVVPGKDSTPLESGRFLVGNEKGSALMNILMNGNPSVNTNANAPKPSPQQHSQEPVTTPTLSSSSTSGSPISTHADFSPEASPVSNSQKAQQQASQHSPQSFAQQTNNNSHNDNSPPSNSTPNVDADPFIHLAKKNLHPVQSRISEWLREIRYIMSSHCPALLEVHSTEIQQRLIAPVWPQLLLLMMIENKFTFTVSLKQACGSSSNCSNYNSPESQQQNSPVTGENGVEALHSPPASSTSTSSSGGESLTASTHEGATYNWPRRSFEMELKELIHDVQQLHPSMETLAIIRAILLSTHLHPLYYPMSVEDLTCSLTNIYYNDLNLLSKILAIPLRLQKFSASHVTQLFCSHVVAHHSSVEKYILQKPAVTNVRGSNEC